MKSFLIPILALTGCLWAPASHASILPQNLRCEYLVDPQGIEATAPRLSWLLAGEERGQKQTACRILVAGNQENLNSGRGDLWDTGKVSSDQTTGIVYAGKPLTSRAVCFWKVQIWDKDGQASEWSRGAKWSMGLLQPSDWISTWITYRDNSPLPADRDKLFLPPARHYRKDFDTGKKVIRAVAYVSALGIYELHLNGRRVSQAMFTPGWSDYLKRVYYNAYDVTALVNDGANAIGAVVAEGWYSGYVGYGLLVGYGPNKAGRCFYGKTPALLVQLELEYNDGSRAVIASDSTWKVTDSGPIREADLIMGEFHDARREMPGWDQTGFNAAAWENAIRAEENGSTMAVFSDTYGDREVELGFQKPGRMQAYPAPPIRVIEEIKSVRITEPQKGVFIFHLGRNIAGIIRLKAKGKAGTQLRIRYGEMLHPDGRLMTENLRRARATDFYVFRGDENGETWSPRFTYHGFQFVEISGLDYQPDLDCVTGLIVHSDTPLASQFECSDPVANQLFKNIVTTQRANFVELPTDCPQRDERMGWMGDAQIYVRAASYNADVAAFFTKWMDDVEEAQRSFGAYPDYAPYPMHHGAPQKSFGTAWMDAGIICPWTIYKVYGDTRIIERHYASMTRFMDFRKAVSPNFGGVSIGNPWGDWLSLGEETPIEYVDACYFAYASKLMAEMAGAIGRNLESRHYQQLFDSIKAAFIKQYVKPDGVLKVDTQTAYVLALNMGLLPDDLVPKAAVCLAEKIKNNDTRMATGFLGTKPLLPVLTAAGHHDLAARLFQSRKFPSWGYEVINGATSIWERWNSFTKEKGFGESNAAMNSFSHYSFGAVCEWMFRSLAGIDTDGVGFKKIIIRPGPPSPDSNPDQQPIDWVKSEYTSINGRIACQWKRQAGRFELNISIPPNTTANVFLPAHNPDSIEEGGQPITNSPYIKFLRMEPDRAVLSVASGAYSFTSK